MTPDGGEVGDQTHSAAGVMARIDDAPTVLRTDVAAIDGIGGLRCACSHTSPETTLCRP
jgi:hypothetical protein